MFDSTIALHGLDEWTSPKQIHIHMQATPHIVARTSRRNVILQTARTSSCVAPIKFQHDLLEKRFKSVQGVLLSRQANLFFKWSACLYTSNASSIQTFQSLPISLYCTLNSQGAVKCSLLKMKDLSFNQWLFGGLGPGGLGFESRCPDSNPNQFQKGILSESKPTKRPKPPIGPINH